MRRSYVNMITNEALKDTVFMVLHAEKNDAEHPPIRLSIEIPLEVYRLLTQMLAASEVPLSMNDLLDKLEAELGSTLFKTMREATREDTSSLGRVEVELHIVRRQREHGEMSAAVDKDFDDVEDDDDDDDDDIRASIEQGLRDVLQGNVLTEEEFWKAVAEDE